MLFPVDAAQVSSDIILKDTKDHASAPQNGGARYYDILEARSWRLQKPGVSIMKSLSFQVQPHIKPLVAALVHFREAEVRLPDRRPPGSPIPLSKAVGSRAEFRPSLK